MAKVYFPEAAAMVTASPPHPPNTQYRISIGTETWSGENHRVVKVQMVYDGKIACRRSPSYPVGTNDDIRVSEVIRKLINMR
jgi:hypothetical protein